MDMASHKPYSKMAAILVFFCFLANNLVPRVYSAFKMAAEAEKTLAHTVRPPAKYSTNRGVFCHVIHNRISSSLHLISGSRIKKWLKMSEDLASMWLHFACFSCFLWTVEFPNTFIVISTTWTRVV